MPLGLEVTVALASQNSVNQTHPEEVRFSLAQRVAEQSCGSILKSCQHLGPSLSRIAVRPDDLGNVRATQADLTFLWPVQILHDKIRRGSDTRRWRLREAVKSRKPKSGLSPPQYTFCAKMFPLLDEREQLLSVRFAERRRPTSG